MSRVTRRVRANGDFYGVYSNPSCGQMRCSRASAPPEPPPPLGPREAARSMHTARSALGNGRFSRAGLRAAAKPAYALSDLLFYGRGCKADLSEALGPHVGRPARGQIFPGAGAVLAFPEGAPRNVTPLRRLRCSSRARPRCSAGRTTRPSTVGHARIDVTSSNAIFGSNNSVLYEGASAARWRTSSLGDCQACKKPGCWQAARRCRPPRQGSGRMQRTCD